MTSFYIWHLTYRNYPSNLCPSNFLYRGDGVPNGTEERVASVKGQIRPRLE